MDVGPDGDGALLAALGNSGDQNAFAALVRRHQTMVFNVCLRVLRERSDAEDAAQAVFIALSHKARDARLAQRPSLAGWLYDAAWHVSVRMRQAAALRKKRESEAVAMQESLTQAAAQWKQLAPVLDSELRELPERYRTPLILHHLEQRSVEETAALVRISEDAAKQRLSRGRELLKDRLTRHGMVLSTGVVAALLTTHASAATAPASFALTTAKAAALYIAGNVAGAGPTALMASRIARTTSRTRAARQMRLPLTIAAVLAIAIAGALIAVDSLSKPAPVAETKPAQTKVPVPEEKGKIELSRSDKSAMQGFRGKDQLPDKGKMRGKEDDYPLDDFSMKKKALDKELAASK